MLVLHCTAGPTQENLLFAGIRGYAHTNFLLCLLSKYYALLCCTAQHSTDGLPLHVIQAGDDKFKAELGWVVNLEMWDAAKQLASQKLKGFSSELASVTSQEQLRLTDLTRLDSQVSTRLSSPGFESCL